MDEELDVARRIQQSLLPPQLPETGWFRAQGISDPSYQVGGDYFDVVPITPELWSFVVADVSWEGAQRLSCHQLPAGSAARCFGRIRSPGRLRAYQPVPPALRAGAREVRDALLCHARRVRQQVSCSIKCRPLRPVSGAEGRHGMRKLGATAMPVGLSPDAEFELAHTTLESGDRLILYSDVESRRRRTRQESSLWRASACANRSSAHPVDVFDAVRRDLDGVHGWRRTGRRHHGAGGGIPGWSASSFAEHTTRID